MIESLESRQFLSATLAGEAVCPSDPAPSRAVEADAVVEKKGTGTAKPQAYLVVTLSDVLISSY
jgi:hypothetical protein